MGITNTLKLIGDNQKLCTSIKSMYELPYELPYLMSEGLKLIEDDYIDKNVRDIDKVSICYMLDMYFSACFYEFGELELEKILNYGKIEVYKVEAKNGIRYATEKEVLHGVRGLIAENIYPAGETEYKLMCLLQWTFGGKQYYLKNAGYKLRYDSSGRMLNTPIEVFTMCAPQLKQMIDWVRNREALDKAIKLIKKMKKSGGYKYAAYESDEIEESITVKQLIYNILNTFPRNSDNLEYRRAMAMALSRQKSNKSLTPYEVSQLREIYDKYATDTSRNKLIEQSKTAEQNKLKDECLFILRNRDKLDKDDFVFKILRSLEAFNYRKCSDKQYAFIKKALDVIKEKEQGLTQTQVISDDDIDSSLEDIYEALGSGQFE